MFPINRRCCGAFLLYTVLFAGPLIAQAQDSAKAHERLVGASSSAPKNGSGTSWVPANTPMRGLHFGSRSWTGMLHGFGTLNHVRNPDPRGDSGTFSTSMLMLQLSGTLGSGNLQVRAMGSGEPTMGPNGYPLLLQTGETADGLTPLFDRQHPHDLVMEMSVSYQVDLASGHSFFVYVAPVGEPAIGPTAFMHRGSSGPNPSAPISHHFQDGTHISHGVISFGLVTDNKLKIEASIFNGREPDENRWDIQQPRFDSYAFRVSVNPSPDWSIQGSLADFSDPEQLHPGIGVVKLTGSVMHHRKLTNGHWQATFVWGRNKSDRTLINVAEARATFSGPVLDHYIGIQELPNVPEDQLFILFPARSQTGILLETAVQLNNSTLFGRVEKVAKDELFDPRDNRHSQVFDIGKINLGFFHDVLPIGIGRLGVGVSGSLHVLGAELRSVYGTLPASVQLFSRVGVGR